MAASMNAACLALMDSGLPLQCLVAAVTCLVDKNDKIILDPSLQVVNVSK
jgi:exosome complex component RRP46